MPPRKGWDVFFSIPWILAGVFAFIYGIFLIINFVYDYVIDIFTTNNLWDAILILGLHLFLVWIITGIVYFVITADLEAGGNE